MDLVLEWLRRVDAIKRKYRISADRALAMRSEIVAASYLLEGGTLEEFDAQTDQMSRGEGMGIALLIGRGSLANFAAKGVNATNAVEYLERRLKEFELRAMSTTSR